MADVGTMTTPDTLGGEERDRAGGRRIRRPRSLPGSRAVVGALLVTAAAVGVFAAYLDATAEPSTRYVVAQREIPIGTVLTSDVVRDTAMFALVAMDLPADVARRAVPEAQALVLEGQMTTAALAPGDLVGRSGLVEAPAGDDTVRLSFPIAAAHALAGAIEPGSLVDVVATFGSGRDAETAHVAERVLVSAVAHRESGLGRDEIVLTLAVADRETVEAVVHAVNTAEVFVTRSPRVTADEEG